MAATENSWYPASGKWKTRWFKKTASVAIAKNVLLEFASGYVKEATTTCGASDTPLAGIYPGPAITSASSDYASNTYVPVLVPAEPLAEAEGAIDTGTPAATDVGKSFDISATNGVTVSTTSNEPVTMAQYISATKGRFVFTNLSSPAA